MTPVTVYTHDPALAPAAQRLAQELDLPFGESGAVLLLTPDRLRLDYHAHDADAPGPMTPVSADLDALDVTGPVGRSLKQPIARAVGLRKGDPHRPTVLDATAGYGEDAWLLAGLGCRVTAVERDPVLALLLADATRRAGRWLPDVACRVRPVRANAIDALHTLPPHEVVYLDPMFPPKRKSARERKAMWVLRRIVGADEDAPALLDAARRRATRRVVVKRPRHAPPLADAPPAATHRGKSHRYDVYPTG